MQREERRITHFFKGVGISLDRLTPITRARGRYGRIALFRHPELGKVFVLNDEIQHVEAWAPLYHEPLVHLPAAFVTEVKQVLILGGGTLYAASEILKYKSVEHVLLLDHDPRVTEIAAQYYAHAANCLGDKRVAVAHHNAYSSSSLARLRNNFDLVINDGADLLNFKAFSILTQRLKSSGVCADVVYRHLFERQRTLRTIKQLECSGRLALSLVFLPEYHGILHLLCIWGKVQSRISQTLRQPRNVEQLEWIREPRNCPCTYYDPRFLHYYLHLPRYVKIALGIKKRAA